MFQEPKFLTIIFGQIILNILIIKLWNSAKLKRFHGVYQAEQKIHDGFVPRFGGLAMLFSLCMVNSFEILFEYENNYLSFILLCLIPLIIVTFLEDVYNNILPLARLFFIFISAFLVLVKGNFSLPEINFPLIPYYIINNFYVLVLLLCVAIVAMVNAFNLIDGVNGLLLFTFLSIVACLYLMAEFVNDEFFILLSKILLMICICQIPFNFPRARIFAGDLGAYAFGYIIAVILIIFFGRHAVFLTWQTILILFYPAFELLFTVLRRVKNKKYPLQADRLHLHQLLFVLLDHFFKNNALSNALTSIILLPIWGFSFVWIFLNGVQLDLKMTCWGLFYNFSLYIIYYMTTLYSKKLLIN